MRTRRTELNTVVLFSKTGWVVASHLTLLWSMYSTMRGHIPPKRFMSCFRKQCSSKIRCGGVKNSGSNWSRSLYSSWVQSSWSERGVSSVSSVCQLSQSKRLQCSILRLFPLDISTVARAAYWQERHIEGFKSRTIFSFVFSCCIVIKPL